MKRRPRLILVGEFVKKIVCSTCAGTGRDRRALEKRTWCPECHGSGVVEERMPWPKEYFDVEPFGCSPIVDAGMERGKARRVERMKAAM